MKPRPLRSSRTMRVAAAVIAAGAFLAYLQAHADAFPPWVGIVVGATVSALGALTMALRIGDTRAAMRGEPPRDPPSPDREFRRLRARKPADGERGAASVDLIILLPVLAAVLAACASAWPAMCSQHPVTGRMHCRCAREFRFTIKRHPSLPPPAGVVGAKCDGEPLPFDAEGPEVVTP